MPFIDLFWLTAPQMESLRADAMEHLKTHWCTSYGVSAVVNAALGTSLPESRDNYGDVRPCMYGFWASFLYYSPFGKAVCALGAEYEPEDVKHPIARMTRFFLQNVRAAQDPFNAPSSLVCSLEGH